MKLEVILGCITFIGKFRFLESVEGKTLGGKEENAFTTTTGENVNAILWGRKIIYSASIVEERREYIQPSTLLGKDENAFIKPFTAESIHFSPSIAMKLSLTVN
jgi:hypothetical protein